MGDFLAHRFSLPLVVVRGKSEIEGTNVTSLRTSVAALHWGQLLLLIPSLVLGGVTLGVGAMFYASSMEDAAQRTVSFADDTLRVASERAAHLAPQGSVDTGQLRSGESQSELQRLVRIASDEAFDGALAELKVTAKAKGFTDAEIATFEAAQRRERMLYRQYLQEKAQYERERAFLLSAVSRATLAVEAANAAEDRAKANASWVRRCGLVAWAGAWLAAFLALWWWFGGRAKPRTVA
jgi:hypothetical protein